MALNKRNRRKPVRKMSENKEYLELTLAQAIDLVVAGKTAEGLRERTLRDYRKDWGYFVSWVQKTHEIVYVHELSPHIFREYINYLKNDAKKYEGHKYITNPQGTGLSDTTINIRLRVYRAIFNYLEREEFIQQNPIANIKLIRQDVDLTNCFTEEEVKQLLLQPNQRDYVGFRDYVAMMILLDCGLRAKELLSLSIADVDFQTRFITLSAAKNKNRKSRLVPVSSHVIKLLLYLIEENKKNFESENIFLSSYGEPLGQNHFNKRLKYYADKAGICDKKVTAHVYRHTWAKTMVLNGCDLFSLQKMGGWNDVRTVRRYIQMDNQNLRAAHDNFSPVMKFYKSKR